MRPPPPPRLPDVGVPLIWLDLGGPSAILCVYCEDAKDPPVMQKAKDYYQNCLGWEKTVLCRLQDEAYEELSSKMRVHGPPWDYQENEFYKCSINSGQHTGMEAIGVAPTRQKYECAASLAIAVTHALKIQGGSHTAHSDFASVVAKALEAQVDYGNKPEMQSSVPQSDPDPIRFKFRAQVNEPYDAEASGYLSLQVNDKCT